MYGAIDTLTVGPETPPACNLPPIPSSGQTVTWTVANSPYQICENVGIPSGATVLVEPGVEVNFDSGRELTVAGTVNAQGSNDHHITFSHPAVFPPMISVNGGVLNATFTDFRGQVRPGSGGNLFLTDCTFDGNGMLTNFSLPAVAPYVKLEHCTFTNTNLILTDTLAVLKNNTVIDTYAQILRGFADVTAPNTFIGQPLQIDRQISIQPLYVNGVQASGVANAAGLKLSGGYLLGPNNILQNNRYALDSAAG